MDDLSTPPPLPLSGADMEDVMGEWHDLQVFDALDCLKVVEKDGLEGILKRIADAGKDGGGGTGGGGGDMEEEPTTRALNIRGDMTTAAVSSNRVTKLTRNTQPICTVFGKSFKCWLTFLSFVFTVFTRPPED